MTDIDVMEKIFGGLDSDGCYVVPGGSLMQHLEVNVGVLQDLTDMVHKIAQHLPDDEVDYARDELNDIFSSIRMLGNRLAEYRPDGPKNGWGFG